MSDLGCAPRLQPNGNGAIALSAARMTACALRLLMAAAAVCLLSVLSLPVAAAPLELEADEVKFDTKEGKSVYSGNVVITQGNLRLTGDVVEVFSQDGEISRVFSRAQPTTLRINKDKNGESLFAEAQTIEYRVKEKRITLRGQVRVDSERRSLRGHAVTYLLESGEMFAEGGERGRVRLIVDPQRARSAPER